MPLLQGAIESLPSKRRTCSLTPYAGLSVGSLAGSLSSKYRVPRGVGGNPKSGLLPEIEYQNPGSILATQGGGGFETASVMSLRASGAHLGGVCAERDDYATRALCLSGFRCGTDHPRLDLLAHFLAEGLRRFTKSCSAVRSAKQPLLLPLSHSIPVESESSSATCSRPSICILVGDGDCTYGFEPMDYQANRQFRHHGSGIGRVDTMSSSYQVYAVAWA